jgi:outer membrane protein, multidrug efflux system
MKKNKILIFILILLINGCSWFNHPYTKPNLNLPNKWSRDNNNLNKNVLTNPDVLAQMLWWQQFKDPELNKIIESALANNNDIKIAISNLDNAQAQLKQINLSWIPTIPLMLGFSQMPILNSPGYFLGLFPSYSINIFSQIKAGEQAKHLLNASKYAVDSTRLTVIGQAANTYFALASQQSQLQLTEKLLKTYQDREIAYRKQLELGLTNAKIVNNAASDIMQIKAQILLIKNNIVVSQNALRYLTNQNPGKLNLAINFNNINANSVTPGVLPLTVLANRPDVKASEEQLKASSSGIGLAYSNLLPSLQIDDFLAQTSSNPNSNTPGNMNMTEAFASVPLLNAKAYGQIDSSKAMYSKDYYAYEQTVRRALRDVENDMTAHSAYSKRYDNYVDANLMLQQGCNNELSQFQNGLTNYTGVLECQISITQSDILLIQSKLDKLMTIVALYQDLGGGYARVSKNK